MLQTFPGIQETININFPSDEAIKKIEKNGYFIFQAPDAEESTVIKVADYFGKRQGHKRADNQGIAEVGTKAACPNAPLVKKQYREQYLALGIGEHKPHTDGSFLEGLGKQEDGSLIKIRRPKIAFLQMVQPAVKGGQSLVIDTKKILEDALIKDGDMIKALMKPYFLFCRDDQQSNFCPILEPISAKAWSIRWRGDFALATEKSVFEAYQYFYEHYVNNPQYRESFYLKSGEILIMDNLRILHGREAFIDTPEINRFLRRIWIADETISFIPAEAQFKQQQSLDLYDPYRSVVTNYPSSFLLVKTGIYLSSEHQKIAQELWFESLEY